MSNDTIDKLYGIPKGEISCPACGQRYGHHNTKVDKLSDECSTCAKKAGYENIELIDADKFIQEVLGYQPGAF